MTFLYLFVSQQFLMLNLGRKKPYDYLLLIIRLFTSNFCDIFRTSGNTGNKKNYNWNILMFTEGFFSEIISEIILPEAGARLNPIMA
jgi:hypothetical protein